MENVLNELMIIKRDGSKVAYDGRKVVAVIEKAMGEGKTGIDSKLAIEIEQDIFEKISCDVHQALFTVENLQDLVEVGLMKHGRWNTAKRFIEYRFEHAKARDKKWVMNDLQYDIWSQKYEWENEGFEGWLDRVSGGNEDIKKLIRQKKFLFGGRILASRGLEKIGRKITLSNCYVIEPPKDNIESIFTTASKLARTFSYGGGCGIHIGKLRPNGSNVNNAAMTTSGATSFMDLFSTVTEIIGQKGRRGALMISIPVSHPDVEEFIDIKKDLDKVTKANISVMITDDFMNAVEQDIEYECKFVIEHSGETISKKVMAKDLFMKLAEANWDVAEPGILMWDNICNYNLLSNDDEFEFAGVNP